MGIRIDGYSERGMLNAVCEDIVRAGDFQTLETFLDWCRFPFQKRVPDFSDITAAQILVEQSFSDFGDLDLLILLDHANRKQESERKQAVLIEAKVATDTPKRIYDQWDDFLSFLRGGGDQTSSLFVQIYRKLRLIERVADLNRPFEPHPIWKRLSLGENRIVLKAAGQLAKYRGNPWYVALVPDDSNAVRDFFSSTLEEFIPTPPELLPGWDKTRMGYLTWPDLDINHFKQEPAKWQRSLSALDWNEHQIYQQLRPDSGAILAGTLADWNGQRIIIVKQGKRTPRAILATTDINTAFFPKSFTVRAEELTLLPGLRMEIGCHQPAQGMTYTWNPPTTEQFQPPDRAPVPTPPQKVEVRRAGWETTCVVLVNPAGVEQGEEFHVFPHHLLRR